MKERRSASSRLSDPASLHRVAAIALSTILGLAPGAASAGTVHLVEQIDIAFVPDAITVAPGDTVRWTWTGGFHTVTSGLDCTFDGVHFNEGLFEQSPTVEYTIPAGFTGEIPYYCAPHCAAGMVGNITVAGVGCDEDLDRNGVVDFADVLVVLGAWGPCDQCPEDLDGSGAVDFGDVLRILAAWGDCD